MENKRKIIIIGSIALFSTSLLLQKSTLADEVYSPIDPNQKVQPVDPSEPSQETMESSAEIAPMEPQETKDSTHGEKLEAKRSEKKHPEEKPMKRKKRYLDDSFFSSESNQFIALNPGIPGGAGNSDDTQLVETLKALSGIALYGRKK